MVQSVQYSRGGVCSEHGVVWEPLLVVTWLVSALTVHVWCVVLDRQALGDVEGSKSEARRATFILKSILHSCRVSEEDRG
jgi:hypothetical protein